MTKRPLLERVALRYFARLSAAAPIRRDAQIYILDAGERARMRGIQRGAIARSALAGALSSVVSGVAEIWADQHVPYAAGAALDAVATYWSVVFGATLVASIFEIGFLYWDALKSVYRLAAAAGLPIDVVEGEEGVALALARAALELPNPPEPVLGVDPKKEASKLRLLLAVALYKGKIALTTFLLKMLIRRVLSRSLARIAMSALPFVAVPVTAVWNGVVTWFVVREARIRALGPATVQEVLSGLPAEVAADAKVREVMVRGVASSIVKKQNLHPNLRELLVAVHAPVGAAQLEELDSAEKLVEQLSGLPPPSQRIVLRLLSVALVLDGKTTSREHKLFERAAAACALPLGRRELEDLRRRFVRGDGLGAEVFQPALEQAA